jgi:hypothetical protein
VREAAAAPEEAATLPLSKEGVETLKSFLHGPAGLITPPQPESGWYMPHQRNQEFLRFPEWPEAEWAEPAPDLPNATKKDEVIQE